MKGASLLLKKWLCALLCLCFCGFSVAAETSVSLSPGSDFSVYNAEKETVASILGLSLEELDTFCREENIAYLAVNHDNTCQIRVSVYETGFSENIGNLSALSDEKILALLPELTGGNQGEVLKKDSQKFIHEQLRSADSGGDYLLDRYTTVASKKVYLLLIYTAENASLGDSSALFKTYTSPDFLSLSKTENTSTQVVIIIALLFFVAAALVIGYTLVRDIRAEKTSPSDEEETNETAGENS